MEGVSAEAPLTTDKLIAPQSGLMGAIVSGVEGSNTLARGIASFGAALRASDADKIVAALGQLSGAAGTAAGKAAAGDLAAILTSLAKTRLIAERTVVEAATAFSCALGTIEGASADVLHVLCREVAEMDQVHARRFGINAAGAVVGAVSASGKGSEHTMLALMAAARALSDADETVQRASERCIARLRLADDNFREKLRSLGFSHREAIHKHADGIRREAARLAARAQRLQEVSKHNNPGHPTHSAAPATKSDSATKPNDSDDEEEEEESEESDDDEDESEEESSEEEEDEGDDDIEEEEEEEESEEEDEEEEKPKVGKSSPPESEEEEGTKPGDMEKKEEQGSERSVKISVKVDDRRESVDTVSKKRSPDRDAKRDVSIELAKPNDGKTELEVLIEMIRGDRGKDAETRVQAVEKLRSLVERSSISIELSESISAALSQAMSEPVFRLVMASLRASESVARRLGSNLQYVRRRKRYVYIF